MTEKGNQVAETTQQEKLTLYENNPFRDDFQKGLKTKAVRKKTASGVTQKTVYMDKDGQEFKAGVIYTTEYYDDAQFIKVFAGGYQAMFGLDKLAYNTLMVILAVYQEEFDRDFVYIPFTKACKVFREKLGVEPPKAKSTFSKGLRKLAEAGFIAKSKLGDSLWWINPSFIYNGDRLVLAKQYIRQDKEQALAIDAQATAVEDTTTEEN